jgi:hypothetical protein
VKARNALGFEGDQSLWYGMEIFNAYNGFNHCLMEAEVKPGTVLAVWEAQAPWWTGGDWPGSGLLGKMMDRLTAPWKGIVQEERDKATARLAALSDFRRSFGVTPREALASPEDRAKVMAAYAQAPDSDGVRRRLEALRIARQSGHLLPAHK